MSVLWLWLVVAFAFYISNLLHTTHTSRIVPGTLVLILNVVVVWYTATSPGAGINNRDGIATVRIGCANRLRHVARVLKVQSSAFETQSVEG